MSKKAVQKPRPRRMSLGSLFKPHYSIPRSYYTGTVILSLVIIFGVWGILSYGGFVKPSYFLPTPTQVVTAGAHMIQTGELWENAQASLSVVIIGWVIATLLAVPLGILMGSLKIVEAFLEPIVDFVRYLP